MNGTVHMILGSLDSLEACRQFVRPGDVLLLADRGVMVLAGAMPAMDPSNRLLALNDDVAARGLLQRAESLGVQLIDDHGWVDLVTIHPHTLSWK